jgi:PPOX class probable F420-dependent enzyme
MSMNNTRPFDPAAETYVSLATYRRNGVEVETPVWIGALANRYYVFSTGDAGKVKRIRANPQIRLAACDVRGKVSSDWITGTARIVTEPAVIAAALQALRAKYGWQMRIGDFFASLTGRMRKRAYLEITLAD